MIRSKVLVVALLMVSVTSLLFAAGLASSFYVQPIVDIPFPLSQFSHGFLAGALLAGCFPPAVFPGLAGLAFWFLRVRKRQASVDRESAALPAREEEFQGLLDGLTQRLRACGPQDPRLGEDAAIAIRRLAGQEAVRLSRFLARCGIGIPRAPLPVFAPASGADWPLWVVRGSAIGLLIFGVFFCLWILLSLFDAFWVTPAVVPQLPVKGDEALVSSLGCLGPCLAALSGSALLFLLLRQESRRRRRQEGWRREVLGIAVERCLLRVQDVLSAQEGWAPRVERSEIARAQVACTLEDLDGAGKGDLMRRLVAAGLLASLPLDEVDLRGADLREVDLANALLQRADFRGALMQRCRLTGADLRGADFQGANLWQVQWTGAQLAGARMPPAFAPSVAAVGAAG